jgi:DMSO/TMAO reductase YedYZ molybdopterin-dependent catalytic subunit
MAVTRRGLIRGAALAAPALVLAGCDGRTGLRVRDLVLGSGEWLAYRVQRLIGSQALAREFEPAAMSPDFRTNGNTEGSSEAWLRHAGSGFADWRLEVGGLVEAPARLSLAELKAMPARSQITRHDCVEGWSAIGKWTGVPLAQVLARVRLRPEARFVVFRCADDFWGTPYYESIDLVDALHPQTILAYGMNDRPLPVGHGAPLRLRVERQLGYKQAKFVMGVEAVASLAAVGKGRGGFWEDLAGYDWYAGI